MIDPQNIDETKQLIVVAGGAGKRMKSEIPKQFLTLAGRPVIFHAIERFYSYDKQMKFIIVLPGDQIDYWKMLIQKFSFAIPHIIAVGGEYRFNSVYNGLKKAGDNGLIAIHDAVRPLTSTATIDRCFKTASEKGNAIPVADIVESIRQIRGNGSMVVNRDDYKIVQTPQVFRSQEIKAAYNSGYKSKYTDDASVLQDFGKDIHLVSGNRENIKITTKEDLQIAETFLKNIN